MLRPRIRPTVSRRNKYIGIAPRAERKLDREARRGSHDLRRLVGTSFTTQSLALAGRSHPAGHANFLDTLIDSLDVDPDDEEANSHSSSVEAVVASITEEANKDVELSDDDTSSDESWSDVSDDEDHTLVRTASGTAAAEFARAVREDTRAAIAESGDDYFSQARHGEPTMRDEDESVHVPQGKKAGITVSVAISPAGSDMTESDASSSSGSPLASPSSSPDGIRSADVAVRS